ncbi:MAG TPA: 50S ribosomal protein L25 [Deltaproteobacteria bacterium]|nr:50S ribosomal protein L25 [Deltaproteobacteria bacterium]HQI80804.1 50S ribosomal protein L25 [Deltaproteobacteria bacterium]
MATKEKLSLDVSARTLRKKNVQKLRREGIIPGVVHGKDFEPVHVQVDERSFEMLYRKAHGTSLVNLNLDGQTQQVLIHSVFRDKLKGTPLHIEFLKIDPKRLVTVEVPLVFTGVSSAEKEGKGKVAHEETSIHLKCSPTDIPSEIEVDISVIVDKHTVIHASDLKLPDGVHLGHGVSEKKVIASLVTTRVHEAAPVEEAAAAAAEGAPAEG